jgi:hypothetical protein
VSSKVPVRADEDINLEVSDCLEKGPQSRRYCHWKLSSTTGSGRRQEQIFPIVLDGIENTLRCKLLGEIETIL